MKQIIFKNLKILGIAIIVLMITASFTNAVSLFINAYPVPVVGTNPNQVKLEPLGVNVLTVNQNASLKGRVTINGIIGAPFDIRSNVNLNGNLEISNGSLYVKNVKASGNLPVKLCTDPSGSIIQC